MDPGGPRLLLRGEGMAFLALWRSCPGPGSAAPGARVAPQGLARLGSSSMQGITCQHYRDMS